jgi:hypothetical protein
MRLNRFNDLPPREEYTNRVRIVMHRKRCATVSQLVEATRLSRTQVLSALEVLLAQQEVVRERAQVMSFRLPETAQSQGSSSPA